MHWRSAATTSMERSPDPRAPTQHRHLRHRARRAGSARKIAENIELVMSAALNRVTDCECGPETSCYGCLRTYRNARFHEQLSRNAALQVLNRG